MCCPSLACGSSVRCSSALCCSAEARVCGFYAAACEYRATDGQNTRVAGGSEVSKDPPTFSYSMTTAGAGLRPARGPRVTRARRRPTCREETALSALRSVRRRSMARRGVRGFAPTAGRRRWPSCNARPAAAHVPRGNGPERLEIRTPSPDGAPRRSRGLGTRAARVRTTTELGNAHVLIGVLQE